MLNYPENRKLLPKILKKEKSEVLVDVERQSNKQNIREIRKKNYVLY